MEQLIILLAIGAISLVNWLIKQSAEARERKKQQARIDRGEQSPTEDPEEEVLLEPQIRRTRAPAPPQDEDPSESMRKLMEALGLPMENEPPKPIQRPVATPPPIIPPELPRPLYREPEPAPRRRETVVDPYAQKGTPPIRRSESREPEMRRSFDSDPAPTVSLHDWNQKKPVSRPEAVANNHVRKMLSSPNSLRDAIILTEILGKPKALQ